MKLSGIIQYYRRQTKQGWPEKESFYREKLKVTSIQIADKGEKVFQVKFGVKPRNQENMSKAAFRQVYPYWICGLDRRRKYSVTRTLDEIITRSEQRLWKKWQQWTPINFPGLNVRAGNLLHSNYLKQSVIQIINRWDHNQGFSTCYTQPTSRSDITQTLRLT